ncbi:MAG: sensor histidine kinase, partial [Acidobacteriota bacterium]
MKSKLRGLFWRFGSILLLILLISLGHYETGIGYRYLHEIYQRVYYIPILLAAFWYGPLGGIAAASLVSIIYAYHIQRDWSQFPAYSFNQYAEMVLYYVVAVIIGFLAGRERKQRRHLERVSEELGRAHEELKAAFDQLRHSDRLAALGQLSAGVAHEIRNPLGSIKGSIEILESEISPQHPKREFVNIIKQETSRLNTIVADFLRFAKPPQPAVRPTSIEDLIDSTLGLVQKEIQTSGVRVVRKKLESIPLIPLDGDQIRQVLLNI